MGKYEAWRIARASCQGSRNAARNKRCQDSAMVARLTKLPGAADTLVAVVADGMGSAKRSRSGARRACLSATERAVQLVWKCQPQSPGEIETILNAAALQARMDVERLARRNKRPIGDYATTLLVLIHLRGHAAALQIGDGAAVIAADGRTKTLSTPQRGEYANETTSLTSPRSLQKARIDIARPREPVTHIALMTDGVMELSLDAKTGEPHDPFFRPIFEWLESTDDEGQHYGTELAELLRSEPVRRRTQDDTTLVVAARRNDR